MMLSLAQTYRNEQIKENIDEKYGDGAAQFFMQAIETFYMGKFLEKAVISRLISYPNVL